MGNSMSPLCSIKGCNESGKFGHADPVKFQADQYYIVCEKHKIKSMVQFYCTECYNVAKYGLPSIGSHNNDFIIEAVYCNRHKKEDGIYQLVRCLDDRCLKAKYEHFNYCKHHISEYDFKNIENSISYDDEY
jgi:hypothetical protein